MKTFKELSENKNLPKEYQDIFKIVSNTYSDSSGVTDSIKAHSLSEIKEIRDLQHELVLANVADSEVETVSVDEIKKRSVVDVNKITRQTMNSLDKVKTGVMDSYFNSITGVGTGLDPSYYTNVNMPVSISPYEASAIYSNGGIAKVIIDKKSKGVILNDYEFEGLEPDDARALKEYSFKIGFDRALPLRDALCFGGSGIYPSFKKDTPETYSLTLQELMKKGILDKDSIDYWITADRWNLVNVPNYDLTAKDYLMPDTIYVPLGAQRVKSQRMALLKPFGLPYWAAIQQLGWSTSDFVGYLKQIYDYEIMISSLPIMFQQMSLIFQTMPFDATMLTNGPDEVQRLQESNQREMRNLTGLKSKMINSIGDIKVIERTFSGFDDMVRSMERNIGARSSIPESVLFHTHPTGFSDNTDDLLLKQSEAVKMLANDIEPQLSNIVKILLVSCFGKNSEQVKKNVTIKFGTPIVSSELDKSEIGNKHGTYINSLVMSGMPLDVALNLSKEFFQFDMDEEDSKRLEEIPEELEGDDLNIESLNLLDKE